MTRSDDQRLSDILDAIDHIEEYLSFAADATDEHETLPSELIEDAILHRFVVIGEAANALSEETTARIGGVPWPDIVGMRNIVAHKYFRIDWDIVRATYETDLANLRTAITEARRH